MLLNLSKKGWTDGLSLQRYDAHASGNETALKDLQALAQR
jgi:26S proteasome regulatory subunit N11